MVGLFFFSHPLNKKFCSVLGGNIMWDTSWAILFILTKFANAQKSQKFLLTGSYICEEFRANYKLTGYSLHSYSSSLLDTNCKFRGFQTTRELID